jgi:small-conductance mechanosensitive channel/CRP-like cAMP-binding protein
MSPVLLVGFFGTVVFFESALIQMPASPQVQVVQRVLHYLIHIGLYLASAGLINRLLAVFFWEGLVARSIRGTVPRLLRDVVAIVVYLIALAVIVSVVFQKSLTGVWATSSVVGIILGLALRNMILDVCTGLAINIERPYKIGDWIEVQQRVIQQNVIGEIVELNWRTTRIETEEGKVVIIPNSLMGNVVVTNYWSPEPNSRFEVDFCLDFSITPARARRVLLAGVTAVLGEEGFVEDPAPDVRVSGTNDRGVEYLVRFWVKPWLPHSPAIYYDQVNSSILEHLAHAGLSLAYPKEDVYIARMPARHLDTGSSADRRQLLGRVELFAHLEAEELDILARSMTLRSFADGETLINAGDPGDSMFILAEGLLHVLVDIDGSGTEKQVAQLVPGQFLGEMSVLTGEPRSATVRTATEVLTYEITREHVHALFQRRPEIAESISRVVAERRRGTAGARAEDSADPQAATEGAARQIMGRIRSFFKGVF